MVRQKAEQPDKLQARGWVRGYYPLSPGLVQLRVSLIKMTLIRAVEIPFLGLSQCQAEKEANYLLPKGALSRFFCYSFKTLKTLWNQRKP